MNSFLTLIQVVLGIATITLVMLQPPSDEIGGSSFTAVKVSKRGWEKVTFVTTILTCILFVLFPFFK